MTKTLLLAALLALTSVCMAGEPTPTPDPTPVPVRLNEPNPIGPVSLVFTVPDPEREEISDKCARASLAVLVAYSRTRDFAAEGAKLRPLFLRAVKACEVKGD